MNDPFLAKAEFYRVLRKFPIQNPVISEPFDTGKFLDLCKKQYVDNVLVGESDLAPFGVFWKAKTGNHTLRVVATDRAGNTAEASSLSR